MRKRRAPKVQEIKIARVTVLVSFHTTVNHSDKDSACYGVSVFPRDCYPCASHSTTIWWGILWGREVIEKGLRWRIGNGEQVKVYQSKWLPRPDTFKLISPPKLHLETAVSELINEKQEWNEELIQQNFLRVDAELITKIPLPRQPNPDQVVRHYDKKGEYSVKSGYQLALKMKTPDIASCSEEKQNFWNAIWYLQIPEKVKIFMWRASNNLLPTAENLWKRKVVKSPRCQRCYRMGESIFHTLFVCKASTKIWQLTCFEEEIGLCKNSDVCSLFHFMSGRKNKVEMELMAALCWSIWHSRNLLIFKNKREDSQSSVATAEAVVQAYRRIQMPLMQESLRHEDVVQKRWKPPPAGWFKANVDAAVKIDKKRTGLGVVIRNPEGKVVAAAMKTTIFLDNVDYAEAEAT